MHSTAGLADLIAARPASKEVWQADLVPASRLLNRLGPPVASVLRNRLMDGEMPHTPLWVVAEPSVSTINAPDAFELIDAEALLNELQTIFEETKIRRPRRIEVARRDVFDVLHDALDGTGIEISLVARLAAIDEVVEQVGDLASGDLMATGPLSGKGVTEARYIRFCDAAAEFWRAAPWGEFTPMDAVVVERPKAPKGMACLRVHSDLGPPITLEFFDALKSAWSADPIGEFLQRGRRWMLGFDHPEQLPAGDGAAFDERWPLAAPDACPWLIGLDSSRDEPEMVRADSTRLSFVEGLLRALACSTPEQIDSGRWTIDVETADGRRSYSLALPDLDLIDRPAHEVWRERGAPIDRRWAETGHFVAGQLIARHDVSSTEEMQKLLERELVGVIPDPHRFEPSSADEAAQALCYEAFGTHGRRRIQLARRALDTSPGCVDAMVLLSEHAASTHEELEWLDRAVDAGRASLGSERLEKADGFWADLSTRPFMRALHARGEALEALDQIQPALECYRELLRLNPEDNQGVREAYLPLLLNHGCLREALAYMRSRPEDGLTTSRYALAIALYLESGDTHAARQARRAAIKANRHAAAILADPDIDLEDERLDEDDVLPGMLRMGGVDEAEVCAACFTDLVDATPELGEWLEAGLHEPDPSVRGGGSDRRKAGFKTRRRKSR